VQILLIQDVNVSNFLELRDIENNLLMMNFVYIHILQQ